MGLYKHLFGKNKARKRKSHVIYAPVTGIKTDLSDVGDPVFTEGAMGAGGAVIPAEGKPTLLWKKRYQRDSFLLLSI